MVGIKVVWPHLNGIPNLLGHTNLVAEEDLGGVALPATIATGGNHVPARIIDVKLRDGSRAVAWNDEKRDGRMAGCLLAFQIIKT